MSNIQLLLINTIGLTGADLLLPKLSAYEEIAILPGQNFSIFKDNLYRIHDYRGWESSDIFDSLARCLYTKDGRMWMGLTKNMQEDEKNSYPKELHKKLFISKLTDSREFTDLIREYILSYYEACKFDISKKNYTAWFSNNVLLNHTQYNKFKEKVVVIHVSCSISRWLTYISQTRTWDCSKAIKFWLVNNLYSLMYSLSGGKTLIINIDELINSENQLMNKIESFLNLNKQTINSQKTPPGFLKINTNIIKEQTLISTHMNNIYKGNNLYNLAVNFDEWSKEFIKKPHVQAILNKYSFFWNSTSHTNFDWIGPIGEELIEEILKFNEYRNEKSFSYIFYHEYFELNSDHYDKVYSNLHHYLGCLENDLIIPPLPYFLRICIEYLSSAARNSIKLGHSYISFKEGKVYSTLSDDKVQEKINRFGLRTKYEELEKLILEAEESCKQ